MIFAVLFLFGASYLAYNLKGRKGLPRDVDLQQMLDVYLGCCSIEMTTEALSVAAATFANGMSIMFWTKRFYFIEKICRKFIPFFSLMTSKICSFVPIVFLLHYRWNLPDHGERSIPS
jgi:hypothetical protein